MARSRGADVVSARRVFLRFDPMRRAARSAFSTGDVTVERAAQLLQVVQGEGLQKLVEGRPPRAHHRVDQLCIDAAVIDSQLEAVESAAKFVSGQFRPGLRVWSPCHPRSRHAARHRRICSEMA